MKPERRIALAKLIKAAKGLVVEAESRQHRTLREKLHRFAARQGFTLVRKNLGKRIPDVLRLSDDRELVFIGDAKVSDNETAGKTDTLLRIISYLRSFGVLIENGKKGGHFAICTDDLDAAKQWCAVLNFLARRFHLVDGDGNPPAFKVVTFEGSRIAYW